MIMLVDSVNWIQAQRAKDLEPYLGGIRLFTMTPAEFMALAPTPPPPVWVASWRMLLSEPWLESRLDPARTILGVTSHGNLGGGLKPSTCFPYGADHEQCFSQAIATLERFPIVTVNSQRLVELLSPYRPVVYTPNGVDHRVFSPAPHAQHKHPVLGWVGKTRAAKNFRMLLEGVRAASKRTPLVFLAIEVSKQNANLRPRSVLRDFYRRLDYYICFSTSEGTPNVCLEAAASGVPIVTTAVGNMPELVREGETGWFVEPTVESLVNRLVTLRQVTPVQYQSMSAAIREDIERDWTWAKRAVPIRKLLEGIA